MTKPYTILQGQIEERIRFETLLADLSARFVRVPAEALDHEIQEAQRRICETLGLDRSTLGQPNKAGEPHFTHSWVMPGYAPAPDFPPKDLFPWATQHTPTRHPTPPSPPTPAQLVNQPPEPRRMIHLDQMRHFMRDDIVEHIRRRQDQAPRE